MHIYVDGVCDIHGPATEKWRGGNVWGKKKNGLYGWKYGRNSYFVCERKTTVRDGAAGDNTLEPTFIYMGSSKNKLRLSKTFPGGKSGYTMKRFSDNLKSSQPAAKGSNSQLSEGHAD